VTPRDLAEWVVRAGLLSDEPPADAALLAAARDLREAIDAAVTGTLAGWNEPAGEALGVIDRWLPEALVPSRLRATRGSPPVLMPGTPTDPGRHALGLIARDAAEMLGTDERRRIRVCASETCSARFYDRSRSGRRRWCSMQGCGNVAKARRHRARQAGSA
jgi:predicted RNA-binding Zn ribbon-like protein